MQSLFTSVSCLHGDKGLKGLVHLTNVSKCRPEPIILIKLPIILFQSIHKCLYYSPNNNRLFQDTHTKNFSDYYVATSVMSLHVCSQGGRSAVNHRKDLLKEFCAYDAVLIAKELSGCPVSKVQLWHWFCCGYGLYLV